MDSLANTHNYLHNSDKLIHPVKGRPIGGRSFIVNKRIKILKYEFINRYLASISCEDCGNKISMIACYLPFDNSTQHLFLCLMILFYTHI